MVAATNRYQVDENDQAVVPGLSTGHRAVESAAEQVRPSAGLVALADSPAGQAAPGAPKDHWRLDKLASPAADSDPD